MKLIWILKQATHAALFSFLHEEDIKAAEELGTAWYRSKEVFPQDIPYAGYLANKKWPMAEEYHLYIFMI